MSEELQELFREATIEHLRDLESALLVLEEHPGDHQAINRVFRVIHTIKGSSAMLGFEDISQFAHKLENEFDRIRVGQASITPQVIDAALEARDLLSGMLNTHFGGPPVNATSASKILEKLTSQTQSQNQDFPLRTAFQRVNSLSSTLNQLLESGPSNELFCYIIGEIKIVRELCRQNHAENINHFLAEFEELFRDLAEGLYNISDELIKLSIEASNEATSMIEESFNPVDLSSVDPLEIINSMNRPKEILETLKNQKMNLPKMLKATKKLYQIKIQIDKISRDKLEKLLQRLRSVGKCEIFGVPQTQNLSEPNSYHDLPTGVATGA